MLERVEVHVVDVSLEILLIPDGVFPKAPLPQRMFAMALDRCAGGDKAMREMRLDPPPAAGEIGTPGGRVQMACMCSGRITIASTVKRRSRRAMRNAMRKALT
jgi:hypothetical protein